MTFGLIGSVFNLFGHGGSSSTGSTSTTSSTGTNFDPNSVTGLVGLWDFKSGKTTADTGLDDGIAQNGTFESGASASGDQAQFNGTDDRFDVEGDNGGTKESVFDLGEGIMEVQFTQDNQLGSSHDTLVNRGEYADRLSEGWFGMQVTSDGRVKVLHYSDGKSAILKTDAGFFDEGDTVNVKYAWSETEGAVLNVENLTSGATQTISTQTTGLTLDIGDNDDEIFTFGARESNDGHYDQEFDGTIDYVAVYEAAAPQPDGAVDGEDFSEVMAPGYDDSNAPTDNGGDIIDGADGIDDLIFGNGGDDTIDAGLGNDTVYGDEGSSSTGVPGVATTLDVGSLSGGRLTSPNGEVSASVDFGQSFNGFDGWTTVNPGFNGAQDELFYANSVFEGRENVLTLDFDNAVQDLSFTIYDVNAGSFWDDKVTIVGLDENGNEVAMRFTDVDDQRVNGNVIEGTSQGGSAFGAQLNDNNFYNVTVNIDDPIVELKVIFESADGGPTTSGYIALGDFQLSPAAATSGTGGSGSDDGDDVIDGGIGDDLIYGDDGEDLMGSGSFTGPRESFNWDLVSGSQADSSVTQDTGDVNVTYTRITDTGAHESNIDNATPLNTSGIDSGSETIDTNSALTSETSGNGNTGAFRWDFSEPVGNVEFNINDLDGDGEVTVRAFDAAGNEVPVSLTGGSNVDVSGNTASGNLPFQDPTASGNNVQVEIDGPLSRIELVHTQDGSNNSGIWITDMYFDTGFSPGPDGQNTEGGNDTITGAEGADTMFGEGGDDTFIVSSSSDGAGDVIDGGNGPDDTADNDVLDLRGAGDVSINDAVDADDAGATEGTVTFADGSVLSFSGIETILFDQNGAPIANPDAVDVDEDGSVTFDPTANDLDPDGDPIGVDSFTQPPNGTVTENPDGTLTYTPDPNFNGTDTFDVTVTDPEGLTSTSTVTVTVAPVNDAPDAVNDAATTDEESPIVIDVLGNDTDVDGDTLTITAATVPTEQGTVEIVGDQLLFTPADDFFGEATISYSITDGEGGTDVAEAVVTVNNVNDDPVAVDDIATTEEDTPVVLDLLGNDEDADGDPLFITSVSVPPAEGTVVDNGDGTVTFTPAPNFNGPATISYTVGDGNGGFDQGEATVSVSSVIDPPTANDDDITTDEDTPVTIDVLANDTDPDNTTDELTITAATVPADQGTVEIVNDQIVFTPAENFNGEATIGYSIADPDGGTSAAEVTVTVTPVNDDPVALDDIENTDEDAPVIVDLLGNDSDVDGDPLTLASVTVDPAEGTVVDNGDGTVTFTPAPDFNGPATIDYVVSDGQGGTDEGQAVVNVGAVNDSPEAQDDASTTLEDTPVTFDVLANDSDVDGDVPSVVSATITEGEGTVSENPDGTLTYTPAPDFNGTAVVTYTITDGNGLNDTAEWTITVTPDGDAPVTEDDTAETNEDTPVVIDPLANDTDPDGQPLTVGTATSPDGTVTINPDGTITFTPDPDFNGPTTIDYTAVDPDGNESPGQIAVEVAPVNDAPDAVNDEAETDEETPIVIPVLANDTDVDGDTLSITAATVPSEQGTVEIVGGDLLYTPADDFFGEATISYSIEDGNTGTDTATVKVTVNNVNDDPVAVDDIADTEEDTPVVIDLLGNDEDVDGDPLTIADVDVPPEQGTVVDNGDGTVTFTPAPNFNGPATITYIVDDGAGGQDEGQATVNVSSVIDPPVANDDTVTTDEDTPVTIDVLANDTDPDNSTDELTVTAATVPADQGTVEILNNQVVFTPAENFNGPATISYSIADQDGGTSSAEVAVTVTPVNDAPVAVDDIETTDEDVPVVVDLLGNDSDVDGDDLTISNITVDPAEGSVVDNGDGTVTFTPALNFNGPATITYEISDGNGGTDTAEAVVSVGAVNDAPIAEDDTGSTEQATPVTVDVLGNDSDPDGDTLEVISATVPASEGTVVNNGDGTVTFTPAPAFVGTATVSYIISDGNGGTASAEVSIVVSDVIGPIDGTDEGQVMDPGFADEDGDTVDGPDGNNDTIFGNGGDDTIDGGEGDDTIDGGDDNDSIDGGDGNDSLVGGGGSDTIAGNEGDDTIDGGGGDDDIAVGGGDEADGGTGDDVFTIDPTDPASDIDVTLDGGPDGTDGNPEGPENGDEGDILDLSDRPEDLDVVLEENPESGTVDGLDGDDDPDVTFDEIEKIITGSGDDTVDGGEAEDPIDVSTGEGDDSVTGGDGDDVIDTGDDNDTVDSGDGDDTVDAGDGDDSVTTGDGNDSVDGGDGDNVIDTTGNNVNDPITGTPISGTPDRGYPGLFAGDDDPFDDRDTVTTGAGDDTITTGDDNDIIDAGDGDNEIDAGFDDDTITTGSGDDLIIGGEGSDSIEAGAGNDTIFAANDPSIPDSVNIPDEDLGGLSPDLVPDNGTDYVDAGAGDDLVFGADDDDTLIGGSGDDTLDGGIDDDSLDGGEGDDELIGGQGADTMDGGDGEDTFLVNGPGDGIGDEIDGGSGGTPVAADDPNTPGEDWDVLDLRGSAPVGGSLSVTETGPDSNGNGVDGFVTYFDADGNEVGTLNFEEIEEVIPCFTPGTLIATPRGEVRVEDLQEGDRVVTRDNGIQEIRWVGCRQMTSEELMAKPRFKPVMIKRGALGNGLPERDMMVSPNHRVLLASEQAELLFEEREVLVAAKHLIGMEGIDWAEAHETTYIHIMFDQHEVILSDGAWTESFQPGDMSLKGVGDDQREELLALFPELETSTGIEAYAAARRILKKHEAALLRH